MTEGALTSGNPYCAQSRQSLLALAQLEEVGFDTVQLHMHEHRHRAPTSLSCTGQLG